MKKQTNRIRLVLLLCLVLLSASPLRSQCTLCGDADDNHSWVDISDLSGLLQYVFFQNPVPPCPSTADCDRYAGINIRDVAAVTDYLFFSFAPLTCPTDQSQYVPTLKSSDTLLVESAYLPASDSTVSVAVWYNNSQPMRYFSCPLSVRIGTDIPIVDTVEAGSKFLAFSSRGMRVDTAAGVIKLAGFTIDSVPPGNGVFVTLRLRASPVDYPRPVAIDTTQYPPNNFPMFIDTTHALDGWIPTMIGLRNTTVGFTPTTTTDTADVFYVRQADLDMDNYSDFVYTGTSGDSLFVIYGKSDGTLEPPRGYFKIRKAALSTDYINADTLLDVVARTSTAVYVLLNQGNRSFSIDSVAVPSPLFARSPASSSFPSISTGFFNQDAFKDAVVSPGILLYGNGSGGFLSTATLPITFDAVAASDFNGDGYDDLAVTISDTARIYLNNGSGNLTPTLSTRIGYHPFDVSSVVSGVDFNRDGKTDFAVVTGQSVVGAHDTSLVTVTLGDGSGGEISHDTLQILGSAVNLAVNDVDRNRTLDICVLNTRTKSLEIYLGNGLGSFPDSTSAVLGTSSQPLLTLAAADLNRDGNPDFISGGGNTPIVTAQNQIPGDPTLADEMVVTGYDGIDFAVYNPMNDVISQNLQTVAGSAFWRFDVDHDNTLDVRSFDYNLLKGEYKIIIRFPPYYGGGPFSMDIRVDGSQQIRPFIGYAGTTRLKSSAATMDSLVFYYTQETKSSMNPRNGIRTRCRQPAFLWGKLVDTVHSSKYQFQLSLAYDFSSPLYNDSSLTRAQFVVPAVLDTGKVYYWRARASDGFGWSAWTRTMAANIGSGCCVGFTGNVNGVGIVDAADLASLVSYFTIPGFPLSCYDEANIDGKEGIVDPSDLACLVSYLTGGGFVLPPCQ